MAAWRLIVSLFGLVALVGCKTGTLPDPNDPAEAGILAPEVIRRQLKGASDSLLERVAKRQITDAEFHDLMAKRANELLNDLPMDKIDADQAWEYAEVLRTAKHWDQAEKMLKIAVDFAIKTKNEDRRINDTLRLAHAQAMQGKVEEGIKTAERVMDASPTGSAPILPAVLLEITPAAEGKGHDLELAKLLEDAIAKHMATKVDLKTQGGTDFILARPHHVRNAWGKVVQLYARSGKEKEATEALKRAEEMLDSMHRV
ncbi:MAG: hypothetical protein BGO01_18710 [Armatimonadetes bacterium 55-13]|nr:hypothetical protein [Armatimonadota bacterium]ODU52578.1 MAG: hypothetical protein ABT09_02595 [bacterium SCN 57-13]OJU64160.1 MAG: hypothetical protein BGO01_18710 [Armatimonadetes bacterium 55-13]